jgi:formamidopyrimidine-DNA glycosylase
MPELPEVETFVRTLRPALIGKTILSATLLWPRTLADPAQATFKKNIRGQKIISISRRAKFLDLELSKSHLLIHLRMSGEMLVVLGGYQPAIHDRLILQLSEDARLIFSDPRKFGRVWLVKDTTSIFSKLGPEPLSEMFTGSWLFNSLQSHHRQLKPLLLDQTFVSGLGNIYTDEALHLAKLHPLLLSNSINQKQAEHLCQAIRDVLEEGISRNGASIDWVYRGGEFQNHFRVYGRGGEPCPVCGTKIKRITIGQRGTHFCPHCQVRTKTKNLVK